MKSLSLITITVGTNFDSVTMDYDMYLPLGSYMAWSAIRRDNYVENALNNASNFYSAVASYTLGATNDSNIV